MSHQISGHGSFYRQQLMAEALVKKGHTVFWISPPGYKAPGVNVITLSLSRFPNFAFIGLYIKLLITFIKNYKILKSVNRVFTLREYDALCMLAMPLLRKIPKVFLSRGDAISIYKVNWPDNSTIIEKLKTCALLIFYPLIQRVVLKFSDIVVVQAEFLMKLLQDRHKGLNFTGIILKNDCPKVNISSFQIHNHFSAVNIKNINLAFISPLFWECKGLGVVVDAIFELERRNLNYKFNIIGDGPHKERMQNALSGLDIKDKVVWHGWLDHISSIINSIDLVIVPSLYDSNPNLILEMLSFNKPILASNIDAHKEMLIHNDLLFENKNVRNLCNKIELFQSSHSNRNTIMEALSNRREKLSFDWETEFINIVDLDSTKKVNT